LEGKTANFNNTDGIEIYRYHAFGMGGFGLIILEATAVHPNGRITPNDLGLWNNKQMEGHYRLVQAIHDTTPEAKIGIQIAHAGRKASCSQPWLGFRQIRNEVGGFQTYAPSPIKFHPESFVPRELTEKQIVGLEDDFAKAAKRAVEVGYDTIEIHGAHGYLINQFLSPITNIRKDKYGGSFENRSRFLLNIVAKMRKEIPSTMPLICRLSVSEFHKKGLGWGVEDTIKLVHILKKKGVDMYDLSGISSNSMDSVPKSGPCYQIPYVEKIRKECKIIGMAVGEIDTPEQVAKIFEKNQADLVMMGRGAVLNPYVPLNFAEKCFSKKEVLKMHHTAFTPFLAEKWKLK